MAVQKPFSKSVRIAGGACIILFACILLVGGWIIPFKYESFSILYKFGTEKTMLRTGKLVGITIVLLLFFQVVLASRFRFFERIFSIKTELLLHRRNGLFLGLLAICHPLLIKGSENFTPYTFEKKYYPEYLGMVLLFFVIAVVTTAQFRQAFRLTYKWWLRLHRIGAGVVLLLIPAHVRWVSDTFEKGVPRNAALAIIITSILLFTWIGLKRYTSSIKKSA